LPIIENIGLRSLCHHFLNVNIQSLGKIHDPANDAKWTLELFLNVYRKKSPQPTDIFN